MTLRETLSISFGLVDSEGKAEQVRVLDFIALKWLELVLEWLDIFMDALTSREGCQLLDTPQCREEDNC